MAVSYTGVPSVEPNPTPSNDYQNIQVNPQQFGAAIGEGLQVAGQAALRTGEFFGDVVADDQSNKWQRDAENLLYGTGTVGADGKPDLGFMGLTGEAALRARPQVMQQLDDLRTKYREGLPSSRAELQFDNFTRRYQSNILSRIGSHVEQQARVYGMSVNDATLENGYRTIANDYVNEDHFKNMLEENRLAAGKNAELTGKDKTGAIGEVDSRSVQARLNGALAQRDFAWASRIYQQYGDKLDDKVRETYAQRIHAGATQSEGDALANGALGLGPMPAPNSFGGGMPGAARAPSGTMPPSGPVQAPEQYRGLINDAAQKHGVPGELLTRLISAESGFNPNAVSRTGATGIAQFTGRTAAQYGVDRHDAASSIDGAARYLSDLHGQKGSWLGALEGYLGSNPQNAQYLKNGVPQLAAALDKGAPALIASDQMVPPAGTPPRPEAPAPQARQNRTGLPPLTDVWDKVWNTPGYSDEARTHAWQKATSRYNAFEADAARTERLATQQQHQEMEKRTNDIWADAYSATPQITAQQIAVDPAFDGNPERRKAMIELINNPPGSGVPAPQSYQAAQSLITRMRLPEGNPDKITDETQIYDQMRSMNKSDLEFTLKQFRDIRSPGNESLKQQKTEFFKRITPSISKSNPLAGKLDQLGDQRSYEFEQYVQHKIDEFTKGGKDPSVLFNPSSPDYVGRPEVISYYQPTMQQTMESITAGIQGATLPSMQPIPEYHEGARRPSTPPTVTRPPATPPLAGPQFEGPPGTEVGPAGGVSIPLPRAQGITPRNPGESIDDYLRRAGQAMPPAAAPSDAPAMR